MALLLRHTNRAVFVGDEVGGADEGNTSGYRWKVELPDSGMKLGIPLLQFRMAWSRRPHSRSVRPDCPAPPEAANVGEHRDSAWHEAVTYFAGLVVTETSGLHDETSRKMILGGAISSERLLVQLFVQILQVWSRSSSVVLDQSFCGHGRQVPPKPDLHGRTCE